MREKLLAGTVTAIVIAPLCAICILGPVAIGGFFAVWFGWMGDLSVSQIIAFGVIAAAIVFGITCYRRWLKTQTVATESEVQS